MPDEPPKNESSRQPPETSSGQRTARGAAVDIDRVDRAKKLMLSKPRSKATREAIAALSRKEKAEFKVWMAETLEVLLTETVRHLKAGRE